MSKVAGTTANSGRLPDGRKWEIRPTSYRSGGRAFSAVKVWVDGHGYTITHTRQRARENVDELADRIRGRMAAGFGVYGNEVHS